MSNKKTLKVLRVAVAILRIRFYHAKTAGDIKENVKQMNIGPAIPAPYQGWPKGSITTRLSTCANHSCGGTPMHRVAANHRPLPPECVGKSAGWCVREQLVGMWGNDRCSTRGLSQSKETDAEFAHLPPQRGEVPGLISLPPIHLSDGPDRPALLGGMCS